MKKIPLSILTGMMFVGCVLLCYGIHSTNIDRENLFGGALTNCGTDPASTGDAHCSSFNNNNLPKPPCIINSHAGNNYTECATYSNMKTTPITKRRTANKVSNGSCDCVKYTCKKSNGVNKPPYWATTNVSKSYIKYSKGSGTADCPDDKPEQQE